ncbi:MAG: ABC transporter permease subunit [Anaerolineaceae bacterium]|nr:ABC transporter permease subunit [Anaerolineaceae bacterium]
MAFPIGIYTALHPGKWLDIVGTLFSQLGVSIPSFWFAILMISFFSVNLGISPPGGYVSLTEGVGPWLKHIIMPAMVTGLVSASIQTRFIRSSMC